MYTGLKGYKYSDYFGEWVREYNFLKFATWVKKKGKIFEEKWTDEDGSKCSVKVIPVGEQPAWEVLVNHPKAVTYERKIESKDKALNTAQALFERFRYSQVPS